MPTFVSFQYGVWAGLAPAHEGDRKGSPLPILCLPDRQLRLLIKDVHTIHIERNLYRVAHHRARARVKAAEELGAFRHEIDDNLIAHQLCDIYSGL